MTKRILVCPDTQIPYHDRKSLKAFIRFVGDYQPDELLHIGDLMDFPQPSRWTKDTRGEFEGSVYADAEAAKAQFLAPLREVYSGPVGVLEGNHDERPRVYLEKYAPALAGTRAFDFDVLLGFPEYKVDVLPEFYEVAPGWVATHGHKGGIRLNPNAGYTAMNAAKRFDKSVIMGHTHRLAALNHTYGYGGDVRKILYGVEVGNLMSMKQAGYLKGGTANWQQGFAILHVDGNTVRPEVIPILNKRFIVEGVTYVI